MSKECQPLSISDKRFLFPFSPPLNLSVLESQANLTLYKTNPVCSDVCQA